jgi:alpha-tubulin suppressor-like RCC1 family protein
MRGTNHFMVITDKKQLYSAGKNNKGQLGIGNTTESELTQVTIPDGKIPKKVFLTEENTFVVMTDNTIYACGNNTYGQLPGIASPSSITTLTLTNIYDTLTNHFYFSSNVNRPTNLPYLSGEIKQISANKTSLYILTNENILFVCGDNTNNRLGVTDLSDNELTWVSHFHNSSTGEENETIIKVDCPGDNTYNFDYFVLTESGKLYVGGRYEGTDISGFSDITPDISGNAVTFLSCGKRHVTILDSSNNIYGKGNNFHLQLSKVGEDGFEYFEDFRYIELSYQDEGDYPKKILCGSNHTVVLTNQGHIYATGANNIGQIGLAGDKTGPFVKIMSNIHNDTTGEMIDVFVGAYTLILTNVYKLYIFGGNAKLSTNGIINEMVGHKLLDISLNDDFIEVFPNLDYTEEDAFYELINNINFQNSYIDLNERNSTRNKLEKFFENNSNGTVLHRKRKKLARMMFKNFSSNLSGNNIYLNHSIFDVANRYSGKNILLKNGSLTNKTLYNAPKKNRQNINNLDSNTVVYVDLYNGDSFEIIGSDNVTFYAYQLENNQIKIVVNEEDDVIINVDEEYDKHGVSIVSGSLYIGNGTNSLTSTICFGENTPVRTDQGFEMISKLIPGLHTINGKEIEAVTETITKDKYIYNIKKNAFKYYSPSKDTIITGNHLIEFNGFMIPVRYLPDYVKVEKIKYNGEKLYNILMKEYEIITINNMKVETLHPKNIIALLYKNKKFREIKNNEKNIFFKKFNKKMIDLQYFNYDN